MTTTEMIKKLNTLAEIGIVNAKDDTAVLQEAAVRLFDLRAKADPMWNQWLIEDEGLFLSELGEEESDWTEIKDQAISFTDKDEAEKFLDDHFMEIGGGLVRLRGDVDDGSIDVNFYFESK